MNLDLKKETDRIKEWGGPRLSGRVTHVIGLLIESTGPQAYIGELCHVYGKHGKKIPCQVVGFKDHKVLLMSLGEVSEIAPGCEVFPTDEVHLVPCAQTLCGRILDALGNPIDDKGDLVPETFYPVSAPPPKPLKRKRITEILPTGIKAMDGLITLGRGQRIGIFSGSGVGKSTLMGMIAKRALADINVIALIGERGREVREFIEKDLGPEGLAKSVVIVATSDQAALLRSKGANVATAIAEYFRDQGKNVILMMDSVSRYAMALREIGLAVGEPPTTKGYTPSVFAQLPRLLERAGNGENGSITGIYTILSEGDESNDPIADQMRSLLDGHIFLSRELSGAYHFPPIDVLNSLSRVMNDIVSVSHLKKASKVRDLLQIYREAEDLINIGAYTSGSNPKIDEALERIDKIHAFLRQGVDQSISFEQTETLLDQLVSS
ncbi:MAG: putative ATP synthase YscN [Chlamydiae bacterium]|nr:putative ATP synthase YscN [Chlamydiota bacterium]